jgi:hypothetical protein
MPPNKRLLPIASALGPPPKIAIRDEEWRRLEELLGQDLQPAIRKEIIAATDRFLNFAVFDFTREPVDEASNRLNALMTTGEELLGALGDAGSSSDGALYAIQLLRRHFVEPKLGRRNKFNALTSIVTSLVVACDKACQELGEQGDEHRRGESWDTWIRNLTEILKRNDLPTAARKDAVLNKSGIASNFVLFVEQLQRNFEERFRRGTQSTEALAVAIGRSRRVTKQSTKRKYKTRKRKT